MRIDWKMDSLVCVLVNQRPELAFNLQLDVGMGAFGDSAVEVLALNYSVPQEIADFPHNLVIRLDVCQARLQQDSSWWR